MIALGNWFYCHSGLLCVDGLVEAGAVPGEHVHLGRRPRPSSPRQLNRYQGRQSCGYRKPRIPTAAKASHVVFWTSEVPGQQRCEIHDDEVGMRILGVLCTLALFLFLLAPAPGYAQDENKTNRPQDDQKVKDKDNEKANDKARQEDKTARPDEGKRQEQPNVGRQDERQKQLEANRPQ